MAELKRITIVVKTREVSFDVTEPDLLSHTDLESLLVTLKLGEPTGIVSFRGLSNTTIYIHNVPVSNIAYFTEVYKDG